MTIFTILSYVLSSFPFICAAETGDGASKTIYYVMGAIGFVLTIAVDVFRLILHYKQAKSDGVITKEEAEQLEKDATKIVDDLKGNGKEDNL